MIIRTFTFSNSFRLCIFIPYTMFLFRNEPLLLLLFYLENYQNLFRGQSGLFSKRKNRNILQNTFLNFIVVHNLFLFF